MLAVDVAIDNIWVQLGFAALLFGIGLWRRLRKQPTFYSEAIAAGVALTACLQYFGNDFQVALGIFASIVGGLLLTYSAARQYAKHKATVLILHDTAGMLLFDYAAQHQDKELGSVLMSTVLHGVLLLVITISLLYYVWIVVRRWQLNRKH